MLASLAVILCGLLPITLFVSHWLPSAVFYALIVICLALLTRKRFTKAIEQTIRYRWLIISYAVLFLVVVLSSWYHEEWAGANAEGALRFLLGLWILLAALAHIQAGKLRLAIFGIYAGGIASAITLSWLILISTYRPSTPNLIIVTFTSLMLLLGVITLYSLKWQLTNAGRVEYALKILVTIGIFSVFVAAQTRTGLLGLPLFLFLAIALFTQFEKPIKAISLLVVSTAVIVIAIGSSSDMRHRIAQGINEITACQGESSIKTSSMCIRLQLWRTAIDAGIHHPFMGLGDAGKFNSYLREIAVPRGWTSQYVADNFGEPHNDLLSVFVGFGVPGVGALLLIYLAPCFYFWPRLFSRRTPSHAKAAAAMGLAVCLGFFFFGLTETMFRRMNTIGFYTVMVAWLMVISEQSDEASVAPT